jgi:glycosyltransferase involved in cell wall biosynthesis
VRRPLIIVASLGSNRGPSHFVIGAIESQTDARAVVLVAPEGYLESEARSRGVRFAAITGPQRSFAARLSSSARAVLKISSAARDFNAAPLNESPAILANSAGAALRSVVAARRHGLPLLVVLHREYMDVSEVVRLRLLGALVRDLRLFAVSPFVQGLAYGSGASGDRIVRLMPNMVSEGFLELGRARLATPTPPSSMHRMLYVGSNSRRKGFDILLSTLEVLAARGVPLAVDLAGPVHDGLDDESLARLTAIREKMPVRFLGRLDSICGALSGATIAFVPAPIESFGRPVLEAAAAGVPVVCSDNPGHTTILRDGLTAWMFDVGRPDRAADAVENVINDPVGARIRTEAAYALAATFGTQPFGSRLDAYLAEPPPRGSSGRRWKRGG